MTFEDQKLHRTTSIVSLLQARCIWSGPYDVATKWPWASGIRMSSPSRVLRSNEEEPCTQRSQYPLIKQYTLNHNLRDIGMSEYPVARHCSSWTLGGYVTVHPYNRFNASVLTSYPGSFSVYRTGASRISSQYSIHSFLILTTLMPCASALSVAP